jgi:hypothetical protein
VIATTRLPEKAAGFGGDREVKEMIAAMFSTSPVNDRGYARKTHEGGGASYFVPSLGDDGSPLAAALEDAMPAADVRFGTGTPRFTHLPQTGSRPPAKGTHSGMLSCLHKIKDGRNIYYFANSTDEPVHTEVTLRGKMKLQQWDPKTGEITELKTRGLVRNNQHFTNAGLQLDPVRSVFLVETPGD